MQRERRTDPRPWTWEPAAGAVIATVLVLTLGVHTGRLVANLIAGAGVTWPGLATSGGPAPYWSSLADVVRGDAAAGLIPPPPPGRLAGITLTRACVGTTSAALTSAVIILVLGVLRRWGPARLKGMASPAEVARVLGPSRLRRDSDVIRPDLARHHRRGSGGEQPGAASRIARPSSSRRRRTTDRTLRELGWRLGTADEPRAGDLWVPWDRTVGVIGPQGSGKTLDLLVPALLGAPGAALVTLTKPEDLLLSLTERARDGRPCSVLDPFGLAEGVPEDLLTPFVWDPVAGCVDAETAERRAKALAAGTIQSAITSGSGDGAARFYAVEAAKVLQGYLHAAALSGRTLDDVLRWVANPRAAADPEEILRRHPMAEPFWHGLLRGSLHGDERTAANTTATVQQAMGLFFQGTIRRRCVPTPERPATDIAQVIRAGGTIYLLGRDDPYASAAPLMTAAAEHVLDTALRLAHHSPWSGRLCPPFLACLDELPSTTPLPTLRTRMANERALGISIIWAAQTRAQLTALFGEQEARALLGLTNILAVFGGSKDVAFNQELSEMLGTTRVARRTRAAGSRQGGTVSAEDIAVLRPEEIRRLPVGRALVIAEQAKPVLARLSRAIDGKAGRARLDAQRKLREHAHSQASQYDDGRHAEALHQATRLGLSPRSEQRGEHQ